MTDNSAVNETTPSTLADLKPKMEVKGTVKRLELFGAFVDIGVGQDGLLHISQILVPGTEEVAKNVNDALKEGDAITVWVKRVDTAQERIDLTMIKPLGMGWNELSEGMVVTGTVVRVERFGAFIEIGAERPGMIHVSELSAGYVGSPDEKVKIGDTIQAKVIKLNRKKKQIDLSMKALEVAAVATARAEAAADDDDEKIPTAFELALRRAMQNSDEEFPELQRAFDSSDANRESKGKNRQSKADKKAAAERRRKQQEEIMARTLSTREAARERANG